MHIYLTHASVSMKSVSGLLHNTLHSSWFITLSTWQTWIWMQVTHGLIKPFCIMEIKTPIHFACVFWVSVAARGIRFTDVHREMTLLPTQAWLDTNKAKWDSNMLLCCGQSLLSFCQVEARYSWLFQNVFFFFFMCKPWYGGVYFASANAVTF